ncbi:GNAT family N-acetyltransferase [Methylobacterium planeticum]|uniref:Uncharacterized protein n=1 Tax=Methylobacterium planeticum TaxID=2615211 RepID=A0A6N6MW50_9HYPH|nr:hypothetical protein [Methylobacterium planeticum]KAB1074019.1 hypothetical protein F6X51_09880 [Methylobacterium planeticum]
MRQGFRVIAGGRSPMEGTAHADPIGWRVDLAPADAVTSGTIAAWRALLTRSGEQAPHFADPDYVLPAFRHLAPGRHLALALAWGQHAGGSETLHGIVPLVLPSSLWRARRAAPWQPPGLTGQAVHLIDGRYTSAVDAALRTHLASAPRPLTLAEIPAGPMRETERPSLRLLETRPATRARTVPAHRLVAIGARANQAVQEIERISEPSRIRDAVETFLLLDAQSSRTPIVADPSEAAMLRVVTRLFAKRRQVSIDLGRRRGEVVSGAVRLGAGDRAVTWRQAGFSAGG